MTIIHIVVVMKMKNLLLIPCRIIQILFYKFCLGSFGWNSKIENPLKIDGKKNIHIGNRTCISYKTWLAAIPLTGEKTCELIIEDSCMIGHFNHIYATKSIHLHKGVLTADKVYISDNLHGYENPNVYIMHQPVKQCNSVEIGEGSWLGENVCVIGASVGKHCVIGANSVVTKDIPDYSVAVGAPAIVIKQYDFIKEKWVRK